MPKMTLIVNENENGERSDVYVCIIAHSCLNIMQKGLLSAETHQTMESDTHSKAITAKMQCGRNGNLSSHQKEEHRRLIRKLTKH